MYDIFWNNQSVGQVTVQKEGLYYRFFCTCKLPDRDIYRISVTDGMNRYDLGICVPEGVSVTLPCKYLQGEQWSFSLRGKETPLVAVPIASGVPFAYLEQLETARLQVTDGQSEILINPVQDPQGSDPNP